MKEVKDRHIIWSNENLDLDDWREDLQEQYPDCSEDELYRIMCETNAEYLSDERVNLNIQLSQPILVIADLGLWNGRRMGYKEIPSGNIRDCLSGGYDYTTWYVDKKGDFRCDDIHHDGTNHYLYRVYKDGVSEYQKDRLKEKLYEGTATRADVTRITRRLGDEIGKVYGWDFPTRQPDRGEARYGGRPSTQARFFPSVGRGLRAGQGGYVDRGELYLPSDQGYVGECL